MEWINEDNEVRTTLDQVLETNEILTSLDTYGADASMYSMELLEDAKADKEFYIRTMDGKVYRGGSVKCTATNQKDKVTNKTIVINVIDDRAFQYLVVFPDGTVTDARGEYAVEKLKMIKRGKK